jgi:hypothetical protein
MSDTPSAGSRDAPWTVSAFLVIATALTLVWATGSWLSRMFDWTYQGFSSASLLQLVGYFVGGALKYVAILVWPVLLVHVGQVLSRRRYAAVSGGLLGAGLITLALTFWLSEDGTPVTTWPHWLLLGVALNGTLGGLAGLGHCAYLARKSRKAGKPENPL